MAKAKQSDTLIVKGEGGAVWEVDDTPAIRGQITDGRLKLLRGPKTARRPAEAQKPPEGDAGAGDAVAPPESDPGEGQGD